MRKWYDSLPYIIRSGWPLIVFVGIRPLARGFLFYTIGLFANGSDNIGVTQSALSNTGSNSSFPKIVIVDGLSSPFQEFMRIFKNISDWIVGIIGLIAIVFFIFHIVLFLRKKFVTK